MARESWESLEIKTKIAYITAIVAFAAGWGLTIAGFIMGAGVISDSVLWVLGQALVYAGSVLGIGMYVSELDRILRLIGPCAVSEKGGEEESEKTEVRRAQRIRRALA